jgi:hypothetical protein
MSDTLLAVDTYCGIYDFLPAMYPHYQKAGFDVIGVERDNAKQTWPLPCKTIRYGQDIFARYTNHRHPSLLPERLIGTMEQLMKNESLQGYKNFILSSWNAIFLKALPAYPGKLTLHRAGGAMPERGFSAPYFFHLPIWFDREIGARICDVGRNLISQGKTELGSEDVFFGLVVATCRIEWHEAPAYCRNNLDEESHYMAEAKSHLKNQDVWWIKGVKTPDQLKRLLR